MVVDGPAATFGAAIAVPITIAADTNVAVGFLHFGSLPPVDYTAIAAVGNIFG